MAEYIATAQVKIEGDFRPLQRQLKAFQAKIQATVEGKGGGAGGLGAAGGAALGGGAGAAIAGGLNLGGGGGGAAALSAQLKTMMDIKQVQKAISKGRDVELQLANGIVTLEGYHFKWVRKLKDMWKDLNKETKKHKVLVDRILPSMNNVRNAARKQLLVNRLNRVDKQFAGMGASGIQGLKDFAHKSKNLGIAIGDSFGAIGKGIASKLGGNRIVGAFKKVWSGIRRGAAKTWMFLKAFTRWLRTVFIAAAIAAAIAIKVLSKAMGELESEANLKAVLRATGNAAGFSAEQLNKMAAELSNVTNFTSDSITKSQTLLATFNQIKGVNFKRAVKAALDLSQILGQDVKSSSIQIGKALQDPVKGMAAMAKSGVSFSTQQQTMIKNLMKSGKLLEAQNVILAAIEGQVGGAAEAAANPLTILKNAFGELTKRSGYFLADLIGMNGGFQKLTGWVNSLVARFDEFRKTERYIFIINKIRAGVKIVYLIFKALGTLLAVLFKPVLWIMEKVYTFVGWIYGMVAKVAGKIPGEIGAAFKELSDAFEEFKNVSGKGVLPEFFKGSDKVLNIQEEITDELKDQTKEIKRQFNVMQGAESVWDAVLDSYNRVTVGNQTVPLPNIIKRTVDFTQFKKDRGMKEDLPKALDQQTSILHGDLASINSSLQRTSVFA